MTTIELTKEIIADPRLSAIEKATLLGLPEGTWNPNLSQAEIELYHEKTKHLGVWAHTKSQREKDRELLFPPGGSREASQKASIEPSVDAKYIAGKIVMHLWIILVVLPTVLSLLYFGILYHGITH